MLRFRKILCPIDFSDPSREAMRVAVDAAQRFDAELVLFHAYPVPGYVLPDGFVPMSPDQIQNLTTSIRESLESWLREANSWSGGRVPIATASQMGVPFVEI